MKILFIKTNYPKNDFDDHFVRSFEEIGHNVLQFDYIETAMRWPTSDRDSILRRICYEQKPDIIFLSKGHTIKPECIRKITKKVPFIFFIFGNLRSFLMHPEIDHFAVFSDVMIVSNEEVYKHYTEEYIENLFYIIKNEGDWVVKTEMKLEGTIYENYQAVKAKPKDVKDVINLESEIIDGLVKKDLEDVKDFSYTCSSTKLFVADEKFKEQHPILYNKMILSGALILEGEESKLVPDLLRWYMKRKSLFNAKKDMVIKNIKNEAMTESKKESMPIKELATLFIDAIVQKTKMKK